jgi:hypothetical protein
MEFNGGLIEIKLDYGIVNDDFYGEVLIIIHRAILFHFIVTFSGCPPSVDGTSQGC